MAGTVKNNLMHGADWFPTICTIAGANCAALPFDGVDQFDALFNVRISFPSMVMFPHRSARMATPAHVLAMHVVDCRHSVEFDRTAHGSALWDA